MWRPVLVHFDYLLSPTKMSAASRMCNNLVNYFGCGVDVTKFYSGFSKLYKLCRKTFKDNNSGLRRLRFLQVIGVTENIVTVFTDVELFEVDQAGNGGGQVGQVVVRHAELLQGLAVEKLLWKQSSETMR